MLLILELGEQEDGRLDGQRRALLSATTATGTSAVAAHVAVVAAHAAVARGCEQQQLLVAHAPQVAQVGRRWKIRLLLLLLFE